MVSQRNRIIDDVIKYLESIGLCVNIGKTKARGNHGIFMRNKNGYRIDISKDIQESDYLSTIMHEFAHYLHYENDSSLKSLGFIFENFTQDLHEELINVTVNSISKDFASNLFSAKQDITNEITVLSNDLKSAYPNFKRSEKLKSIENKLPFKYKYLLRYDRVKIFNKIYSIEKLSSYDDLSDEEVKYITLKSKQRILSRINSKIRRLNKYYNNLSELFARFIAVYSLDKNTSFKIAPNCTKIMDSALSDNKFEHLKNLINIIKK